MNKKNNSVLGLDFDDQKLAWVELIKDSENHHVLRCGVHKLSGLKTDEQRTKKLKEVIENQEIIAKFVRIAVPSEKTIKKKFYSMLV